MNDQMKPYRVSICRGGTSKGIFIKKNELPNDLEQKIMSFVRYLEVLIKDKLMG